MRVFPAKTPEFVKSIFPQFLWQVRTDEKELFLTFDDGPTPEVTPWVLNCLKTYRAKATFFCIGKNIEQHPDIFQDIRLAGHAVGNHTQHHLKGWKNSTRNYINDVVHAQNYFDDENGIKLFRPPYGKLRIAQARELVKLGYKVVLWDVLSYDWDSRISPEKCLTNVISKASNGSIIVMHDSIKASQNLTYALPGILEYFSKKGFRFNPIG